jgi:hypothetical protein
MRGPGALIERPNLKLSHPDSYQVARDIMSAGYECNVSPATKSWPGWRALIDHPTDEEAFDATAKKLGTGQETSDKSN